MMAPMEFFIHKPQRRGVTECKTSKPSVSSCLRPSTVAQGAPSNVEGRRSGDVNHTPMSYQRWINGFGTSVAVEIQTLFTCRYSLIMSCPLSRPIPDRL